MKDNRRTWRPGWDLENSWSPEGPRGMAIKDRSTFAPAKYVRKWKAGNEERIKEALETLKSLKIRVLFQILEHQDDIYKREDKGIHRGKVKKKYTTLRGKTLIIKQVPSAGMVWQIIDKMQEAAREMAKK